MNFVYKDVQPSKEWKAPGNKKLAGLQYHYRMNISARVELEVELGEETTLNQKKLN